MKRSTRQSALPGLTKVSNLTGYVPERLLRCRWRAIADRPIDVGYRSRKPPYWLGGLGHEKWQIAERFAEGAAGSGLRLDISYRESDRLYGGAWLRFVGRCKAMLGVESGSSVFDFDGNLQRDVDAYVAARPDASFEEVHAKFLAAHEGGIRQNQISPRCFEAAALRTAMVLFEGEYSGVLQPGRHYISLRKDFGNLEEVLAALRDATGLQRIVDCAYEEVARSDAWSYRSVHRAVRRFGRPTNSRIGASGAQRLPISRGKYLWQLAAAPPTWRTGSIRATFQWLLLGTPLRGVMFRLWGRVPASGRAIHPAAAAVDRQVRP